MKFYETHFEEYINENNRINLHPKLDKLYERFPTTLSALKNVIFFGPNGTGKYKQMLKSIKKYSPTELKYEKKIHLIVYFFVADRFRNKKIYLKPGFLRAINNPLKF